MSVSLSYMTWQPNARIGCLTLPDASLSINDSFVTTANAIGLLIQAIAQVLK